jgi:phage-related minor tail protein
LQKDNKNSAEAWRIEIEKLVVANGEFPNIVKYLEEVKEEQEKNKTGLIDLNALTLQWAQDLQSGLADAIVEGKNFGEVLTNIGAEMVKIALKMAMFGADGQGGIFGGMFGDLLGGVMGGGISFGGSTGGTSALSPAWAANNPSILGNYLKSAKGNVFLDGGITPFGKGGVVPRPTVFPMANGMGLMSEGGPEAIMPLGRDSRGRLAVFASGGGTPNVNVHIENQTGAEMEVETTGVSWDDRIGEISVNAVVKNIGRNGVLAKMLKAGR